jgi:hypothetical protein
MKWLFSSTLSNCLTMFTNIQSHLVAASSYARHTYVLELNFKKSWLKKIFSPTRRSNNRIGCSFQWFNQVHFFFFSCFVSLFPPATKKNVTTK